MAGGCSHSRHRRILRGPIAAFHEASSSFYRNFRAPRSRGSAQLVLHWLVTAPGNGIRLNLWLPGLRRLTDEQEVDEFIFDDHLFRAGIDLSPEQ